MTNPLHDKALRRITGLIAKAASTDSPAEAEALRAKADELIAQYSIEQFQLDEAAKARGERPADSVAERTYSYPYQEHGNHGTRGELNRFVDQLFMTVARGIGVRVITGSVKRNAEGGYDNTWRCVGYAADIAHLDLLFVSLQLALLGMLNPMPDPAKSYDANVHALHDAGVKWERIAQLMNSARSLHGATWEETPWEVREESVFNYDTGRYNYHKVGRKDGGRLIRAYRRHCAAVGLPPLVVNVGSSYREDFVSAFCSTIRQRMAKARSGTGGELVLARRQQEVDDLYSKLFAEEFPPETPEQKAARLAYEATLPKAKRLAKPRYRALSEAGAAAGRLAGSRADLSRPGERVSGNGGALQ